MAQKDYIQKGNPKGRGRAAPAQEDNAKMPVIPLIVLAVVLGGFGYFLWSINGAADNAPEVIAEQPTTKPPKTVAKSQQQEVPPPPKSEDWQYMEELKNKTVEVPVAKLEKKGPFLMQCATFKDGRRAEAFKAQLALLNFESRIKVTQGKNGTYHRVQLGPFETNRDAQRARHQLSKHKINGCKIWLWS